MILTESEPPESGFCHVNTNSHYFSNQRDIQAFSHDLKNVLPKCALGLAK